MNEHRHTGMLLGLLVILSVAGCTASDNQDLAAFMDAERNKPATAIEPLPEYPPYIAVIYSSAGLRSPFNPPISARENEFTGTKTQAPNKTRPREYLERFNVAELRMVGTIEQHGVRWALIADSAGSVHRVKAGNYVGRNYGRISDIRNTGIQLTEVVVDGQGGWIERPRSLNMATN